jgi:hypothetical protein
MGNWSCLYHWFEFNTEEDAKKAYQKLATAYHDYNWTDKDKTALKFGHIGKKLIQAVTTQKWGLLHDFTFYIHRDFNGSAAMNAGVDEEEYFSILGNPISFVLSWDYFFIANINLSVKYIFSQINLNGFSFANKFHREAIVLDRPQQFCKPFLYENDVKNNPVLTDIIKMIKMQKGLCFVGENEKVEIVFGRQDPIHGDINFGVFIYFKDDESFFYETTGCYNVLKDEQVFGKYLTPLQDEPVL